MKSQRGSRRVRLIVGVGLLAVSMFFALYATIEMVKTFTLYVGWEVDFVRTLSAVSYALSIGAAFAGVRLIRRPN